MLHTLNIQNYALITSIKVEFDKGLSTITGETGAGKSILMGALSLILGARADLSSLKDAGKKCIVEGVFKDSPKRFKKLFDKHDLDLDEEIILRREILPSGKSRAFVNDTPVTLPIMKEVGDQLVNIHAQHQNLMLNQENFPVLALDGFLGLNELREKYQQQHRFYREKLTDLNKSKKKLEEDQKNKDFVEFQLNQLLEARLDSDKQVDLEKEREVLDHAEEIQRNLGEVVQAFDEEENSVLVQVKQAISALKSVERYLPSLSDSLQRLESLHVELKDIVGELSILNADVESNPDRLEVIQERLDLFYTLQQKHQVTNQEELIALRNDLDRQLLGMELSSQEIDRLQGELAVLEEKLWAKATDLSARRGKGRGKFSKEVLSLLAEMGMANAQFTIDHEVEEKAGEDGIDQMEFLFSSNKNQNPVGVTKVASGGEVSRLMLSIKGLVSKTLAVETLIFDEIDAGVSGEIADKMGRVIKSIADGRQVLNITHLPQVASKGDFHYMVYKYDDKEQTHTAIKKLNPEERVDQLARMLSGERVTEDAIRNAQQLLN